MSVTARAFINKTLSDLQDDGLKRVLKECTSTQSSKIIIKGKEVLNFCSNNYLGLADHPEVKQAAIESIKREGFGSGASRLVCGNMTAHQELEKSLAQFKNKENCLVFSTGYMANIGIISSLFGREDIIFSDRLNHASIIDGVRLSQSKWKRYSHCNMQALEDALKNASSFKKRCIVTDSVFSMDGDLAPLDKIVVLAKKYDAMVMIDEAHALGVLGKNGRGAAEHFGVEGQIDIHMGTLSKAVGSFGAYCCGSSNLISYLINKARSFIYTTGMPPSVAAASLKSIDIIKSQPNLREQLWSNAKYVQASLLNMGFNIMKTETPIIPILVKDAHTAVVFSNKLFEQGIFVSAIRPPTVPQDMSRLRLTVMATHTREELDYVIKQLNDIGKGLCLI